MSLLTPFEVMFGRTEQILTFNSSINIGNSLHERLGHAFKLLDDDGTAAPAFIRLGYNFNWEDRHSGDNDAHWAYVNIKKLFAMEIKTREDLDLACMLYPLAQESLREYYKGRF